MSAQLLSTRDIIGLYFLRMGMTRDLPLVNAISSLFQSNQLTETYAFLGQVPAFREWLGERQMKGFLDDSFTITNKHYEASIKFTKSDVRRDKSSQVSVRLGELAQQDARHWAKLLMTLIEDGTSTACYDGQFFFDTDHSEGDSGTQDNDIQADISTYPVEVAGSTTVPSVEEMQFAIQDGINQIMDFVDDKAEPLNEDAMEFAVLVPTPLRKQALSAVSLPMQISAGQSGMQDDGFRLTVHSSPRLTWTDSFAVFRTDGVVKPLIRQEETASEFRVLGPESEHAFKNDEIIAGVDAWRNVGYGFWQHACYVTLV